MAPVKHYQTVTLFIAVALIGLFLTGAACAETWTTFNGQKIEGKAIEFNFATKMVTLEDEATRSRVNYNTRDLDFSSRRKLFLSPIFHRSFPDSLWTKEKLWLIGIAVLSPVALLIMGMWLAGLFIAKRFNPFSAIGAFLGSWIAGVILTICYFVFAQKSDSGMGLIYVGIGIATLVMALFISAMYRTTFVRGIFIFIAHVVFAALLGYIVIFGMEKFMPVDQVSAFWQQWVFSPTGLIEGVPREGY